jgi:hypothetical protein
MKRIFRRPRSFNCQKQFTNSICGKHVAKMFNFTFVSKLNYPSKKQFSQEILPELVEKTSRQYVLLALANHFSTTASFDLWISKGVYDFFALVINFLSND